MENYKIKNGDKAAFINLLNAKDVEVDSYQITDDASKPYFEFKTENPRTEEIVDSILKTNTKINQIKEMGKLTKSQLAEIIREELANAKKEKINEDVMTIVQELVNFFKTNWNIIGPALGVILPAIVGSKLAISSNMKSAKEQLSKKLGKPVEQISDDEAKKAIAAAVRDEMQQKYGGSSR